MTDILNASLPCPAHDVGGRTAIRLPAGVVGTAEYGGIGNCYRYRAEYRQPGAYSSRSIAFIMMNPSVATADQFDPTLAKCWRYAKAGLFGTMIVGNVFAYRATDQGRLAETADPVGPDNDLWLNTVAHNAATVVLAYGTPRISALRTRGPAVARMLRDAGVRLHVLRLSGAGVPCHPLYLPGDLTPVVWEGPQ